MKLKDKIYLKIERKSGLSDKTKTIEGEFTVIGVSYGLPHCFGKDMYSNGFNSFEYAKEEEGRPDVVSQGAIYVPTPNMLDESEMTDLYYDKKIVSWKVLE